MIRRHWLALFAVVTIGFGIINAIAFQWLCDDAFITFRYFANFVRGEGLVFNPGERVEGYTNFLWGLWGALAMFLGIDVETWSIFWGISFYAASLILLLLHDFSFQSDQIKTGILPIATVFAALHSDWQIYATSGLETSFQTFLLIFSFVMLFRKNPSYVLSGILAGLATLTRQDSILFFIVACGVLVLFRRKHLHQIIYFVVSYLVLVIPFFLWRLGYYSDIFPNTYYAKSADLTWYSQGFFYAQLYFRKYWIFGIGLLFALFSVLISGRKIFDEDSWRNRAVPQTLLAAGFCFIYTWYIVRVGGDFMFARMLVPLTPFLAITLEMTLLPILHWLSRILHPASRISQLSLFALLLVLFVYQEKRWSGLGGMHGVVNEWYFYKKFKSGWEEESRKKAQVLNKYFDGLNIRIGYFGGEARMLFYMPDVEGIECETGLTDYFTAHLHLSERGRVGHEKKPPIDYLIDQRRVHFVFAEQHSIDALQLRKSIPNVKIRFDDIEGQMLYWDKLVMQELKKRGAVFQDFPQQIDRYIENMDAMNEEKIRHDYKQLKRFYFRPSGDWKREQAFLTAEQQIPVK